MIIHLKEKLASHKVAEIAEQLQAVTLHQNGHAILVTPAGLQQLDQKYDDFVHAYFVSKTDIQLAGKHYIEGTREVDMGRVKIGGASQATMLITGPCSVESEEQIIKSAELLNELGLTTLRAGAYKPRTSPYSFQGLGRQGLDLLSNIREKYGLQIITEVRDATHVEEVIEYADIIQIGAKAMYDQGILRRCGKTNKPVLLKRGFGTNLQEFVQAAEFILSGGNANVVLCERGIRTFETKTRFTLDLCGVAYLKYNTNLPVFVDPSHAMGYAYGVPDLARAAAAMGVDGLLIESHPDPSVAKSDAAQQLDHEAFKQLFESLGKVAAAVDRKIV